MANNQPVAVLRKQKTFEDSHRKDKLFNSVKSLFQAEQILESVMFDCDAMFMMRCGKKRMQTGSLKMRWCGHRCMYDGI
jgi:hypothetical protein